jgi:cation transport ATPase
VRAEPPQIAAFLDFTRAVSLPVAMSGLLSLLVAVCAMLPSSLNVIGNTCLLVRKHSQCRFRFFGFTKT